MSNNVKSPLLFCAISSFSHEMTQCPYIKTLFDFTINHVTTGDSLSFLIDCKVTIWWLRLFAYSKGVSEGNIIFNHGYK